MPSREFLPMPHRAARCGSILCGALISLTACSPTPEPLPGDVPAQLAGRWQAHLSSPGGELPFGLEITADPNTGELSAVAINGAERAPFSGVEVDGTEVVLAFDWYDARIRATYDAGTDSLLGAWRKVIPGGESRLPFTAVRGDGPRFEPLPASEPADGDGRAIADVSGAWEVEFTDEDGTSPARGEFTQAGREVTGTFLTPTGDYRFLAGSYEDGTLRLSTFDGAHAFLFSGTANEDGALAGDFWSRDVYHATWTATRAEDGTDIDWQSVGLANDDGRFRFEFPDLDGQTVSIDDERFAGRVVVVNIFGSWCPNCNDEAPLLAEWDRRWRDDGLAIVGLAYEFSGDPERDTTVVRRYAARHGIEFPLLLAGTSDKKKAAATLPDLTEVLAYPTTVFIARDGTVRRIHSGFAGPGTGTHHQDLVASLETTITELLAF